MLEPVIKTIEVLCSQEKAYDLFANKIASWWPLEKFCISMKNGGKLKSLEADIKPGGKIVEISEDGSRHDWAIVKSCDPSSLFSMNFYMGDTPDHACLVEVRFTESSASSTTVELKHSNWEACGKMAEGMRKAYDFAWGMIFEQAYKKACES